MKQKYNVEVVLGDTRSTKCVSGHIEIDLPAEVGVKRGHLALVSGVNHLIQELRLEIPVQRVLVEREDS